MTSLLICCLSISCCSSLVSAEKEKPALLHDTPLAVLISSSEKTGTISEDNNKHIKQPQKSCPDKYAYQIYAGVCVISSVGFIALYFAGQLPTHGGPW